MAQELNQEEVLIARNNDTGQVGAVTGLNEDGTPKMTDVKSAKLSDLVKFSKGQNPLEAFMSNFVRQCKNPSTFGFFRVPADRYDTVGTVIGDLAKDPVANAEILKDNKVDVALPALKVEQSKQTETSAEPSEQTADEAQSQTTMSQEPKWQAIDQSKIDWDMLKEKWGIDKEALEASGDLREMLYNRKSKLVNITPTFGGEKFSIEARLSFRTDPDGSVKLVPHFIQSEQKLDQFMGHKFDKIDQANLKENGNLGRIVELIDPATGEKVPSLISRDRYTNELLAIPAKDVRIRDTFGQTKLTMPEIMTLKKGLPLPPKEVVCRDGKTHAAVFECPVGFPLSLLFRSLGRNGFAFAFFLGFGGTLCLLHLLIPVYAVGYKFDSLAVDIVPAASSLSDNGTRFRSPNSRRKTTPTGVSPSSTTWSMRRDSPALSICTSTRRNSVR